MSDYTFVIAPSGKVAGIWLQNSRQAIDLEQLAGLLIKHNFSLITNEFSPIVQGQVSPLGLSAASGRFVVVPNMFDDRGGCFVMFGSALAPGEEKATTPISKTYVEACQDLLILGKEIGTSPSQKRWPFGKTQRREPTDPSTYYQTGNIQRDSEHCSLTPIEYLRRGADMYKEGKLNEALRDFTWALILDPTNIRIHMMRGVVLYDLKRYREALPDFEKVAKLGDQDAEKYIHNIHLYLQQQS